MNKICTTIEQSKKLIELGIDVKTADMWWAERYKRHATMDYKYIVEDEPYYYLSLTKPSNDNYSQDIVKNIPAWSLSALMELIPDKISINDESYYLYFTKKGVKFRGPITWDGQKTKSFEMDNILDAAFETVCWLLLGNNKI